MKDRPPYEEKYADYGVFPNYRVSISLVRENVDGTETHPELLKGEKFCFYGEHNALETYEHLISEYLKYEKRCNKEEN